MRTETKQYRSPVRKLMRFFERSRDKWKERCLEAKRRIKLLHTKVADLRASRERWKEEAKQLRVEVARLRNELEEEKVGRAAC
jgi:predicted  nucleic acid-binding Zn-ribbon protein